MRIARPFVSESGAFERSACRTTSEAAALGDLAEEPEERNARRRVGACGARPLPSAAGPACPLSPGSRFGSPRGWRNVEGPGFLAQGLPPQRRAPLHGSRERSCSALRRGYSGEHHAQLSTATQQWPLDVRIPSASDSLRGNNRRPGCCPGNLLQRISEPWRQSLTRRKIGALQLLQVLHPEL